jgi:predicted ATPase with chaperone activity
VSVQQRAPHDRHSAAVRVPPAPGSLRESGLSAEAITKLILKVLHVQGAQSGKQLTEIVRLPFEILDEQLLRLQNRRFLEVVRTHGPARGNFVFDLAGAGRDRAKAALESSQYVGPAPVPLSVYREWIEKQSVRGLRVGRERIRDGFSHLVIDEHTLEALGPAVNSASSLFLYGDPGNGKTVIAEAIAAMLGGDIFIPYAVEVDGQEMVLYDPVHHAPVSEVEGSDRTAPWLTGLEDRDRRFIRIKRPVIFVGGELSLNQLDLEYDPYAKVYQAPFQLKACGGVLTIDDFGRQMVPPRDLLNRWIVPLEKRLDYLTLHTGVKFPVPFDCLLVFATNLNPRQLVDEAFMRRIQYKINIGGPDPEAYREIFRRACDIHGVRYDETAVEFIYQNYYADRGIRPRACHPRDIIEHLVNVARYEGQPPRFAVEMLAQACDSYFLVMAGDAVQAEVEGYQP